MTGGVDPKKATMTKAAEEEDPQEPVQTGGRGGDMPGPPDGEISPEQKKKLEEAREEALRRRRQAWGDDG